MLPEHLKTTALKAHYWLDKELEWCYLRYASVEDLKNREHWVLIYHIKCDNQHETQWPRIFKTTLSDLICSGCGKPVEAEVLKQANAVWLLEKTNYVG